MDKIKKYIISFGIIVSSLLLLLIMWALYSFLFLCDDSIKLGGGYIYYPEQKFISGKTIIPPTVIDYNYNSSIIVVKQKPKETDNIMYPTYNYYLGRNIYYFWIIDKKTDSVIGPIDGERFFKELCPNMKIYGLQDSINTFIKY